MENLYIRQIPVQEDEGIPFPDIHPHLILDDPAQGIEALPHVRGIGIEEEPVGVIQAEHG